MFDLRSGIRAAEATFEPAQARQVRRGRRLRTVGWAGALASIAVTAATQLASRSGSTSLAIAGVVLAASLLLINWTRLWIRESKEPFQYTFSVEEFEPGPDAVSLIGGSAERNRLVWLRRDLTEKLGERVGRLSLLEDSEVPAESPSDDPLAHVHISGWYGPRRDDRGGWCMEVAPRVRLGGKGAPHKLARPVHFPLGEAKGQARETAPLHPPPLTHEQYEQLFERVYWSVASEIYAQIRRGVEKKIKLLPPGRLRAAAYLHEADDYGASNTLDAYDSARQLYRRALELYAVAFREPAATAWRRFLSGMRTDVERDWCRLRLALSTVLKRLGRREILIARSQHGYARMLVAEWNLRALSGSVPDELFEAIPNIEGAIWRLERLPADVPERQKTLFGAYITAAILHHDLGDPCRAKAAIRHAEELFPERAIEDAEFLLAEGLIECDHIRSMRLLSRAIELRPKMERARFRRTELLEELWRRQEVFEPDVAETIDEGYAAVLAINPGNLSAWASRGYVGWLLSEADPSKDQPGGSVWRRRARASLEAGRQYKEVRSTAMVAELNWNLARFAAEKGDFPEAYSQYINAVSAMLAEPRLEFIDTFHKCSTKAMITRFDAYKDQVEERAVKARGDPSRDRLIKSVLAFVLNECGHVHYAHYLRTGADDELRTAVGLLEDAASENKHFILPKYKLSEIHLALGSDPKLGLDLDSRAKHLAEARQLSLEVWELEPHWFQALLRLIETENALLQLSGEMETAATEESEETDPEWKPSFSPERWLKLLLPHSCFENGGEPGARIDCAGTHVSDILKDRSIRWRTEFNNLHVLALETWVSLLSSRQPTATLELAAQLREVFHRASEASLSSYIAAAAQVDETAKATAKGLAAQVEECEAWRGAYAKNLLREDPSHHYALSQWYHLIPDQDDRREALRNALDGFPSPATEAWVKEQTAP